MFINFNAFNVSIMTIVAVDAIAADRALATIGAFLERHDQRHPLLSDGQSTADDRGCWQRETFGGPDVHWRPMAPSAAPGSQRRSHTTATSVLATEAPQAASVVVEHDLER